MKPYCIEKIYDLNSTQNVFFPYIVQVRINA